MDLALKYILYLLACSLAGSYDDDDDDRDEQYILLAYNTVAAAVGPYDMSGVANIVVDNLKLRRVFSHCNTIEN